MLTIPMRTNLHQFHALLGFQTQQRGNKSLLSLITEEITANRYTRISACAAYASYQGVVIARTLLANEQTPSFRWLIGLDDCITDPQAIKVAAGIHNSESRVVPVTAGRRFHAKAYLLDSAVTDCATLIIGSANLTKAALTKNCEGYVLLRARTKDEVELFQNYWKLFWQLGEPASEERIAEYEERYKKRRLSAPEVDQESTSQPLPSRDAKLVKQTLGSSKLAWIELGKNTGPGGSQLDIVKRLAPFIGLPSNPTEGRTIILRFNSPTGSKQYQLTFTKGMWRFMNLQQGFTKTLRPDLSKPSPYLLIISRKQDGSEPALTIERVGGKNAERMIQESKTKGFIDSSTHDDSGRLFGWY
jgi:HKD family nuclease